LKSVKLLKTGVRMLS